MVVDIVFSVAIYFNSVVVLVEPTSCNGVLRCIVALLHRR